MLPLVLDLGAQTFPALARRLVAVPLEYLELPGLHLLGEEEVH